MIQPMCHFFDEYFHESNSIIIYPPTVIRLISLPTSSNLPVPTANPVVNFHHQVIAPAGRTKKNDY